MRVKFSDFYPYLEIENINDVIMEKLSILDILDMYKIEYARASSGSFSHKAICPFKIHKNGNESTPSFYVSVESNSYHCFGCQSNNDTIGFISQYEGCPREVAINKLCKIIGITKDTNVEDLKIVKKEKNDFRSIIEDFVFNAGVEIREFIKQVDKEDTRKKALKWADKQFKNLDEILDSEMNEAISIRSRDTHDKIKTNIIKLKDKYQIS